MADLSVSFTGIELKNPVMLASGVWDLPYTELIDFEKLGGIVYKSISLSSREGNLPPRLTEIPCGVINSIGLANKGIENFNKEILPQLKDLGTEVFVSIFGESIEEFAELTSRIADVSGIEVNISCPNVKEGGLLFGADPDIAYNVTKAVCSNTDLPVIVKLTPEAVDIVKVALSVKEAGASAITASNTFQGLVIDIETHKPIFRRITGGVSGPAIRPLSLYKAYQITRAVDIPIIGSGGITDWMDALEYFFVGVSAIEVGSAIFNNPLAPIEIIDNINRYMDENEYKNILEMKGEVNEERC